MKTISFAQLLTVSVVLTTAPFCATAETGSQTAQIQAKAVFSTPIQWVGTQEPPSRESEALLKAIEQFGAKGVQAGFSALETFLTEHPESAWSPSLHVNLAEYYRSNGRYSLALMHWEAAWTAAKSGNDARAKKVAVRAVAGWTRLLASLGEKEKAASLFAELEALQLPLGIYGTTIEGTKSGVAMMNSRPGVSYRCGSYALGHFAKALNLDARIEQSVFKIQSPDGGFRLSQLISMAESNGISVQAVRRPTGAEIIVPSVVHWKLNHYAAIVEKSGNRYRVVDPTFECEVWMEFSAIDAEAGGAFLVPKDKRPAEWPFLSKSECAEIYGKGYPNTTDQTQDIGCPPCCDDEDSEDSDDPPAANDGSDGNDPPYPPDDPPDDCPQSGGSGPKLGSAGMPQWGVSEPYITLWLHDVPLFYRLSSGKEMKLKLTYKHRDVDNSVDNQVGGFGTKWTCNWLELLQSDSSGALVGMRRGARTRYNTNGAVEYSTSRRIRMCQDISCNYPPGEIQTVTGGRRLYNTSFGYVTGVTNYFLTQRSDRYGRSIYFNSGVFGSVAKLTNVVDIDGLTNTLTYGDANHSNLITAVTDPYGRTATFKYDASGRLTNIVDMAGLSSSFQYDGNDNITNLITPYGQTAFQILSGFSTNAAYYNPTNERRSILVTEPTGDKQLYAYCDNGVDGAKHSYHWNRAQYAAISDYGKSSLLDLQDNDYKLAEAKDWYHGSDQDPKTLSDTIRSVAGPAFPPSGYRNRFIEFSYQGQTGDNTGELKRVTYVKPNGAIALQITRNSLGRPTSYVHYDLNLVLATYTNIFDSSGTYLKNVYGPDGEMVRGYGYHPIITNLLTSVTNAVTNVIHYTHNTNTMKVTGISFPGGLVRTNVYFTNGVNKGFLQMQADIGFRTNYFAYQNGNLTVQTNELGLVTTYSYDNLNRLVCTAYPDGATVSNVYEKLDLVGVKDRLNQWTRYLYNEVQQLVKVTNANDQVTQYSYCGCGGPDQITRWNGATPLVTSFNHDIDGRVTNVVYPDGYQLNYTYDNTYNLIQSVTDNGGHKLSVNFWQWFGLRPLLTHLNWDTVEGPSLVYNEYDNHGRIRYSRDRNGVVTTNSYDLLNRLAARRSSGGGDETGLESFHYDARGLSNYVDQLGHATRFVRDAAGRLLYQTNANNEVLQFTYNAADELLTLTDGKNQTTSWKYDQEGRVTNKTDAASNVLFVYKYDANSRLTNRWSAAKGNTFYRYDPLGNLTNVDYSGGTGSTPSLTYGYDGLNRLTAMADGVGNTAFTWTDGSQLASEDGPWASDTISYNYTNRLRSALSLAQPNASPWAQTYGYSRMRLAKVVSPAGGSGGFKYWYTSDSSDKVSQIDLPGQSGYDSVVRYYDGLARLQTADFWAADDLVAENQYAYDAGSQRTQQVVYVEGYPQTMGYTYDNIGQLKTAKGYEYGGAPRVQEQFGYEYDAAWNLSRRTNFAMVQTFNVDNRNQLTSASRSGTMTVAGQTTLPGSSLNSVSVSGTGLSSANATIYADGSWARTNATLANGINTYTAVATDTRSPARADTDVVSVNLPSTATFVYDLNGNLWTNNSRSFDYDDENQLVRITESNSWKAEFSYDGLLRRRVRKEFAWTGAAWLQTNEVRYIYDGMLAIQERDANNLALVTYTRGADLSGTLEGAGGIGGLLARTENSKLITQNSGDAHAYYFSDANGNVTAMINTNGQVVARYNYDPYGNLLGMSGPLAEANTYRFSSKEFHAASALYYYGYRFYAPSLQRWLNRDPLLDSGSLDFVTSSLLGTSEFAGADTITDDDFMGAWVQVNLNPHEFGRNSPVNYFDPFGEADCPGGLGPGSLNPENLEALQTPAQALRQAVIRKLQQSKIYGKGLEGAKKIDPAKLKDLLTRGELEQAKQVAKEGIQKAKDLIKNTTNEKTRKAALEALETQLTRLEACVKASGL